MPRSPTWLLPFLLGACAAAPLALQDPEPAIAAAEQALREQRPADALQGLATLDEKQLPRRLRDRHDLTKATAEYAAGGALRAFEIIEGFPDRHPHSELRPAVAELQWQIGQALLRSDGSFLFFWSERRGARTVLEHLITRHPDSTRVPDALRLLGDMAFDDSLYLLAQERYRDLMRRYPESEWVVYARFRFAMSIVAGLLGPEYDLDQMDHASRELRDFLRQNPENPDFVTQATEALGRLTEWRAERHWRIAGFYRTVDNPGGERLHLEQATAAEFTGTAAFARAAAQLATLPPAAPAVSPTTPAAEGR